MKALVLAAGKSTRIRAVSGGLPKPLIPIAGRPILDHTLDWLRAGGVTEVWINLHYRGNLIRAHVGTGERLGLKVHYSEEDPILGTAGAVWKLQKHWDDVFLVVYGDNLVRFTLSGLLETHRRKKAVMTLALFDPDRNPHTGTGGGRVELAGDGNIHRFVEGVDISNARGPVLINAGVYAVDPKVVEWIPDNAFCDFGHDVFPRLLAYGVPLAGHPIDGYCLGLDTPEQVARGLELLERGEVKLP